MTKVRLVNGIECDVISTEDRGLNYGDGLFETVAVRRGVPLCWDRHVARLNDGCRRLNMACPGDALLFEEAGRVCAGLSLGVPYTSAWGLPSMAASGYWMG